MRSQDMNGKVALVTGGSSGIGRASARTFAEHGANVIVADVAVSGGEETVQLIESAGGSARFVEVDVSDETMVATMVSTALDEFGYLDYAINNAGIHIEDEQLVECTEETWQRVLDVNLTGIWRCMKAEIPVMIAGGGGAIVNTSSILGRIASATAPAYTASKHGVIGLTKSAALAYGKEGIRVNTILPGVIRTGMYAERVGDDPADEARFAQNIALGRIAEPEEVAATILWLCSDSASFVNGAVINIDGGEDI